MSSPDIVGYKIPKEKYNLTPEQHLLVEEYHKFIFVWLFKMGLDYREYYDVVVFGFLSAIQEFDPKHPRANLISFLWCKMSESIYAHRRFENSNKRRLLNDYLPLELKDKHGHSYSYPHLYKYNLENHVEIRLFIDKILSGEVFNPIQTAYIKLVLYGYSKHTAMCKITKQSKKSLAEVKWQIENMRIMLKSYVRYGV